MVPAKVAMSTRGNKAQVKIPKQVWWAPGLLVLSFLQLPHIQVSTLPPFVTVGRPLEFTSTATFNGPHTGTLATGGAMDTTSQYLSLLYPPAGFWHQTNNPQRARFTKSRCAQQVTAEAVLLPRLGHTGFLRSLLLKLKEV